MNILKFPVQPSVGELARIYDEGVATYHASAKTMKDKEALWVMLVERSGLSWDGAYDAFHTEVGYDQ